VIPATWEAEVGGSQSEANPGQNVRSYLKKITKAKRAAAMVQVVTCLPSYYEHLSSNSIVPKKQRKRKVDSQTH
jgi:hypothetical protein